MPIKKRITEAKKAKSTTDAKLYKSGPRKIEPLAGTSLEYIKSIKNAAKQLDIEIKMPLLSPASEEDFSIFLLVSSFANLVMKTKKTDKNFYID